MFGYLKWVRKVSGIRFYLKNGRLINPFLLRYFLEEKELEIRVSCELWFRAFDGRWGSLAMWSPAFWHSSVIEWDIVTWDEFMTRFDVFIELDDLEELDALLNLLWHIKKINSKFSFSALSFAVNCIFPLLSVLIIGIFWIVRNWTFSFK